MNLFNSIELFVKTIESGSFSEVGRRLQIAPSSVSRQINALEEELGIRLLQRTTRSINLTEAGQIYFEKVSKILDDLAEAKLAISQLQATPKGLLRINAAIPFGERNIVPLIPEFLNKYPKLKVELILEDRSIDLIEERVDLSIRIGRLEDSSLVARKLKENNFVVCGSQTYFQNKGTPTTPDELKQHNCIVNKNIFNSNSWHFKKGNSSLTVPVTGNFQANTGGALFNAILSNLGIAVLPTWYVGEEIAKGNLQVVLKNYEVTLPAMTGSAIYALYPAGQYLPPKTRVFIDYLVEKFNEDNA
ncbi:MAG: LysR family transcriptional regulator [Gammaproteobacteria bacterium]|nr:LysR family transcriptional regulator [Gammaproteobacteria bacterium]